MASGAAVMPWAITDSPIVTYVVARIVAAWGRCASSTTITANTIDARPRGPNHPRKPTVGVRAPLPIIATATGSMRISVRLSTAYSTICQVTCLSTGPRSTAPKIRNVTPPRSAPSSSLRRDACSDSRLARTPKIAPATKAAMNPDPPSAAAIP